MNGNQNEDLKVPRYRDMRTGDAPIHLPTTPFPQCIERNPTTRLQAARTRAWLVLPHARWATTWLQAARTRAWLVLPHAGPRHGCKQLGPGPGWSSHTPDGMRQISGADHSQIPLCCEKFLELTMVRSCCSQDEVLFWALLKLDTDSHSHLWG